MQNLEWGGTKIIASHVTLVENNIIEYTQSKNVTFADLLTIPLMTIYDHLFFHHSIILIQCTVWTSRLEESLDRQQPQILQRTEMHDRAMLHRKVTRTFSHFNQRAVKMGFVTYVVQHWYKS